MLEELSQKAKDDFSLLVIKIDDWNNVLSPWYRKAIFGKEDFAGNAGNTLANLLEEVIPDFEEKNPLLDRDYYLCGYSLAGLFALWAAYQSDFFSGVIAASASLWFDNWLSFIQDRHILCKRIYLSLGDQEDKAKNPILATVKEITWSQYQCLKKESKDVLLEWNSGNHFQDVPQRISKGMLWIINDYS